MFIQCVHMYVYVSMLGRRGDSVLWMTKLVLKNKCISPSPYHELRSMATSDGWKWLMEMNHINSHLYYLFESQHQRKLMYPKEILTIHRAACHRHLLESHQGPEILLLLQLTMWGQLGDWMEASPRVGPRWVPPWEVPPGSHVEWCQRQLASACPVVCCHRHPGLCLLLLGPGGEGMWMEAAGETLADVYGGQAALQRDYPREWGLWDPGQWCLVPAPTNQKGLWSWKLILNLMDGEAQKVPRHRAGGCMMGV